MVLLLQSCFALDHHRTCFCLSAISTAGDVALERPPAPVGVLHEAGALLKVLPAPLLAAHEGEEVAAGRVAALLLARLGVGHVLHGAHVVAHVVRAALEAGCLRRYAELAIN